MCDLDLMVVKTKTNPKNETWSLSWIISVILHLNSFSLHLSKSAILSFEHISVEMEHNGNGCDTHWCYHERRWVRKRKISQFATAICHSVSKYLGTYKKKEAFTFRILDRYVIRIHLKMQEKRPKNDKNIYSDAKINCPFSKNLTVLPFKNIRNDIGIWQISVCQKMTFQQFQRKVCLDFRLGILYILWGNAQQITIHRCIVKTNFYSSMYSYYIWKWPHVVLLDLCSKYNLQWLKS